MVMDARLSNDRKNSAICLSLQSQCAPGSQALVIDTISAIPVLRHRGAEQIATHFRLGVSGA
jgi:hypothetical protein